MGCRKKNDMARLAAPAQIAHQRLVERRRGGKKSIINRVLLALVAQVLDKLVHDLAISRADGLRVGRDPQVQFLNVFEDDVAVKRQIQFGLVQQMEHDHVIALEAKQAQPLQNLFGLIEQIGDQNNQAAPRELSCDFFEDLAD